MFKWRCLITLTFFLVALSACNMPAPETNAGEIPPDAPTLTAKAVDAMVLTQVAPILLDTATTTSQGLPTVVSTPTSQVTPVTATPTLNPEIEFCTDKATFVEDVTVVDGTIFSPGTNFTKTWRLRNVGTCAWTPQYKLTFQGGDQLSGEDEIEFTDFVDPGNEAEFSVQLTAPASNGYFEGEWMLRSADGHLFGIGADADKPFWVRITVSQTASALDLGTPTWTDSFNNGGNWYLVETDNTEFSIKNGNLIMKAINAGKGEEWGLANTPKIKDFYIEATFTTGDDCSGKDRYGILFRAPDPNAGYVMGFSCDGRFRIYKWDGEHYFALEEWKPSASIVSGPKQTNRMGIQAQGETLKIFANDKLLGEYQDNTFDKGRFGLFIGSGGTAGFTVIVEEIAYWLIGE